MAKTTCGELVRDARLARGLTRDELALKVGASVSTLVRIETHNRLPNARTFILLSRTLEIPLEVLAAAQ